jgi:hypothetical protein
VLHGRDRVLQLASLPLFPPNITVVKMAKQSFDFPMMSRKEALSLKVGLEKKPKLLKP